MFTSAQLEQIRDQLIKSAGQPKSITVDGETFTQHGLTELLAAYRTVEALTPKKNSGLRFAKIVPPGA
jgi:hypothetical protein